MLQKKYFALFNTHLTAEKAKIIIKTTLTVKMENNVRFIVGGQMILPNKHIH